MNKGMGPREKLLEYGKESLSDYELLAILLRTGTKDCDVIELSKKIIENFGSLSKMFSAEIEELKDINGIGEAKALTILAALEIAYRAYKEIIKQDKNQKMNNPLSIYKFCSDMILMKSEIVRAVFLNTKLEYLGFKNVSKGTLDGSLVHPREVFREAILKNASSIILVHNHPSGNPDPSDEDKRITEKITDSGKLIGINLLDHIIIGKGRFYSFKAKRIIKAE